MKVVSSSDYQKICDLNGEIEKFNIKLPESIRGKVYYKEG